MNESTLHPLWRLAGTMGAAAALLVTTRCGVDRRCRTSDDCDPPEICLPNGKCGIECRSDDDCELDEACESSRCVPACLDCSFLHASSQCVHGDCTMLECDDGWHDVNGEPGDGCEYPCHVTEGGVEICDYADNDCNGVVDDPFDLMTDMDNCGECGRECPTPPHTDPTCNNGTCRAPCEEGWYEQNGDPDDGCESDTCTPAEEVCDMVDNDCDGDVDEGFVKDTPESCGDFCEECDLPHCDEACVDGVCRVDECHDGYLDCVAHEPGCETECTPTGEEVCDGRDNDCDCRVDEGLLCCPDGMVNVEGLFCMDVYEASRPDARDDWGGEDGSRAVSVPGVLPWAVPNDATGLTIARDACAAAGKRLCTEDEWLQGCKGPDGQVYAYGDDYDPLTCNGIDAHCDDPYPGCGRDDYLEGDIHFTVEPTGAFPGCTNEYGVFDINGNLWELIDEETPVVRGGAYNCSDSAYLHRCEYESPAAARSAVGFRCCL